MKDPNGQGDRSSGSALPRYFDRICIINLPQHAERKVRLSAQLQSCGLAMPHELRWVNAISGNLLTPPSWWQCGAGAWGCLLSHARVVQDAMADGVESLLVLEDDATFHPRAAQMLDAFMQQVPADWDQIYLGGQHLATPAPVPGAPMVYRPHNVNRTHAYALKQHVMARFHEHIWAPPGDRRGPTDGWQIDHQLGSAHESRAWNLYSPLWWLCGQEAGQSSTCGAVQPRYWWQPPHHAYHLPIVVLPEDAAHAAALAPYLHVHMPDGNAQAEYAKLTPDKPMTLRHWIQMTAAGALDRQVLPACSATLISPQHIQDLWPPGIIDGNTLTPQEALALTDYPWHGNFKLPLGFNA
jgi:hypothetical protein